MKLSTRIILLILGCLLPILAAQIHSQINLHAARQEQLSDLALRQVSLANADMGSIVNGVSQLGAVVLQFPEVLATGPRCTERLTMLRNGLPQYRFLGVYALNGALLCGSAGAPDGTAPGHQWIAELATTRNERVGLLVNEPNAGGSFLPVGIHIPSLATGSAPMVLVAAIDTAWIANHLDGARFDHTQAMAHAALWITDREGTVAARLPAAPGAVGHPLPDWLHGLVNRETQGIETVHDARGHAYIAAYVSTVPAPLGLAVVETMALPDVTADIDRATWQDLLIICTAATVALLLAWMAGRRFIYRPTEALLLAARRWKEGDLSARARLMDAGSEFSALAQSFNAMAAGLQAREMERRLQAGFLEAQVAERTRELSETNNRLQVEIAGREKTEAALHQAQKLQAVGQLAGGIAHDFNNMLATVLGNLELMERRISQSDKPWVEADSERMMRLINRATGAVHRGSQLTSRLLAFSRRQRLTARPTDINTLLRELITLAISSLGRRVQVQSDLAEDLWTAMVDPSQVEAAILNLCLNSRDAMPDGGEVLISTANIVLEENAAHASNSPALRAGGYVRICISDTGRGMTPEVRARAFEPFFTTKGPGGSGLGLSQVYGMARQSGGDVTIDSTPNEGTLVSLYLPRAVQDQLSDTAAPARDPAAAGSGLDTGGSTDLVLVVDDDNAVRQVTVEMIRDLGCDVAQAAGGKQALELLETLATPPTLVLLDYAMPGMNGLQLAKALRKRGLTAPIALVTGYAELAEADVATSRLGGLLRKPFTIQELQGLLVQLRRQGAQTASETCLEPGLTQ